MENRTCAGADGEGIFNFQTGDLGPDRPALDQLQALMAEAEDQFSQDHQGSRSLNGGSFDIWAVPLPQGLIDAMLAHHAHSHADGMSTQDALPDIPEMTAAKENTPVVEQAHAADENPLFQAALAGVSTQAGKGDARQIEAVAPAVGQAASDTVNGSQVQAGVSDVPARAGNADNRQIQEDTPASGGPKPAAAGIATQAAKNADGQIQTPASEWVMKENMPEEGVEKAGARVWFQAAAPVGNDGRAHTNRLIQERLPDGPAIAEKASDSAAPHRQ
ncbi:MAG: hypothetical protein V2I40_03795, partial [Desulfobacteraceae bacterium]|nr:hypothetical protein [Desulfobacteraceae bacterium]